MVEIEPAPQARNLCGKRTQTHFKLRQERHKIKVAADVSPLIFIPNDI
jgi:hypothetical protein